jgi:hypothetical protein
MSNRNFDASTIIKILKVQNAANNRNRYQSLENASVNQLQPNPQTEHYDAEVVNEYNAGSQAYYLQGVPTMTVVSPIIFPAIAPTSSGSVPTPILPGPPTITSITPGNGTLVVYYTAGTAGSNPITNYAYSLTGPLNTFTALSPSQTSNPLIITGLTNNTLYNIAIQAITADGNSTSSNGLSGTPLALPPAPTILSVITGTSGQAVVYFSQDPYYPDITNYQYSLNGGAYALTTFTSSPITITGLTDSTTSTIKLRSNTSTTSSGDSNIASVYITTSSTTIQTFFAATTWTAPPGVTTVNYLVVGGGGGTGNSADQGSAGGGGGGMVLTTSSYTVSSGNSYSIVVGTGGQGAPSTRTQFIDGSGGTPSSFGTITALGGGFGYSRNSGRTGRNGLGGSAQVSTTTAPTGGSGGGNLTLSPAYGVGGGGGGAGGAGSNGVGARGVSTSPGGSGGSGVSSAISGTSITYGLGGNGGASVITGSTNGTSGSPYSGNGGNSGSAGFNNSASGGSGGSGIVILRY